MYVPKADYQVGASRACCAVSVDATFVRFPCDNSVRSSFFVLISCDSEGALPLLKQSNFLDFSEILESRVERQTEEHREKFRLETPSALRLKPERDPPTNRTAARAELGKYLSIVGTCLNVQQIPGVEHRLSANRQPETRQLLCDLDT